MYVTDYVFLNENRVPTSEWEGVDPKLRRIIEEAARRSGTKVEIRSGAEKRRRPGSAHNRGLAIDLWLIDENGNRIPHGAGGINEASARGAAEGFGAYEEFAKVAREVQQELYPELDKAFRWGGYFSGDPNRYGSLDTMQFDIAGSSNLGMLGGSWETGLTDEQRRLWEDAGYQIGSGRGSGRSRTTRMVGVNDPYARALLDTIAGTESPGYNVLYGGGRFDSYADHPRQAIPIRSGPNRGKTSSAAGRYQFLGSTWDEAAAALGLEDFSPENQDRAALWLAQRDYAKRTGGRDLMEDLRSGDPEILNSVGRNLSATWTSLPSGIEQNPRYRSSTFADAYMSNLGSMPQASSATPRSRPEQSRDTTSEQRSMPRNTIAALAQDFGQEMASSPIGEAARETTKRAGNALLDNPIVRGIQDNISNADYKIGRQQALAMLEGNSPAAAAVAAQQDFFTKGAPIQPGGAYPSIPFPRRHPMRPRGAPIQEGGALQNDPIPQFRPPNPNNAPPGIGPDDVSPTPVPPETLPAGTPDANYADLARIQAPAPVGVSADMSGAEINPDAYFRRTDDPLTGGVNPRGMLPPPYRTLPVADMSGAEINPDAYFRRTDDPLTGGVNPRGMIPPPAQVPVAGSGGKGGLDAILAQMLPNIVPPAGGELTPQGMLEEYTAAIEEMNTPYEEPNRLFGRFSPALMGIGTALSQIGAGESVDLSAVMEAEARRRREKEAYRLRQLQLAKQKFDAALAARGMTVDEEQFERTAGFREAEIGLGRDRLDLRRDQHALNEREFAAEQERLARQAAIEEQERQREADRRAAQAEQNARLLEMLMGGGGEQPQSDSMLLDPQSVWDIPGIDRSQEMQAQQPSGILGEGGPNDLGLHPAEIAATAAQLTDPEANGGEIVADLIGAGQERNVEMRGQDLRYQASTNDLLERRRVDLADRRSATEQRVSNRVFAEALQQNAIQHGMYSQARAIGDILGRLDPDQGITDEQFATIEQLATPPDSIRETTAIANITGAPQQDAFRTAFPSPEQQGVMDQKLGMVDAELTDIAENARTTRDLVPALEGLKDTITYAMENNLDISGPAVSFFGPFTNLVSDALGVNQDTVETRQQFEAFAARLFPNLPRTPGATSNIDVQKISQQIADASTTEEAALVAVNGMLNLAKRYQAYEQHMRGYESVADFERRKQEWIEMQERGDLRTQPVIFRTSFDTDNLWKAYQRGMIDENTILYDKNGNAFTKESSQEIMNAIIESYSE